MCIYIYIYIYIYSTVFYYFAYQITFSTLFIVFYDYVPTSYNNLHTLLIIYLHQSHGAVAARVLGLVWRIDYLAAGAADRGSCKPFGTGEAPRALKP